MRWPSIVNSKASTEPVTFRATPLIGVGAPLGCRESSSTVAAPPLTATVRVTVSPARTSPMATVASVPGPVKRSCAAPAGTPLSVKRPLASAVVVTDVPTTATVVSGGPRVVATPSGSPTPWLRPRICPVTVASGHDRVDDAGAGEARLGGRAIRARRPTG